VSGDSARRKREPSRHSREDAFLAEKIVEAFQRSVSLRRRTQFTTLNSSISVGERFAQARLSQCSGLGATAHVSGQNLLTCPILHTFGEACMAAFQLRKALHQIIQTLEKGE
jgi:hypothetical protein